MLKLSEVKGMTKQELLNIVLEGESSSGIDFALPRGWLDEVSQQDPAKYGVVRCGIAGEMGLERQCF